MLPFGVDLFPSQGDRWGRRCCPHRRLAAATRGSLAGTHQMAARPPGLPTIFPGIPPQLIGIFPWPILDSLVAVGPLIACNLSPVMWINHVASGHIHDEYLMRPDDIPAYRKRTLLRKLRATFPAHQFSAIRISCWIKALELRSIIPVHYLSAQHRARTRFKHMQTRCNYAKLQICIHVALSVNTSFA